MATVVGMTCLAGCQRQQMPQRAILILLDAARADRLSCYGYERSTTPRLDALAAEGVLFRNHFSQSTATLPALPTLLFSRYFSPPLFPASARVPVANPGDLFLDFDQESISLPHVLAGAGMRTCAISAHTWTRAGTEFARQFDELHDLSADLGRSSQIGAVGAERVTDAAIEWLQEHEHEEFFLYLHYMDPHMPHFAGPDTRDLLDEPVPAQVRSRFGRGGWPRNPNQPLSAEERRYLDALYDGDLRHADRQIGRLFDWLHSRQLFDTTLLVITADHGEHLLEVPGRWTHGGPWLDAVARVPLILRLPSALEPEVYDGLTEAVDVMPTVASLLGVPLPATKRADGLDLRLLLNGDHAPRTHAVAPGGIRSDRFKLLLEERQAETTAAGGAFEPTALYDLRDDPLETRNLLGSRPDVASRLRDLWLDRIEPSRRRSRRARREEPPPSAFAIAARHFEIVDSPAAGSAERTGVPPGWKLSTHWRNSYLEGMGGAPVLTITFPVPNGPYEVSASLRGGATIELAGGDTASIADGPPPQGDRMATADLGVVLISDSRFVARLQPGDGEDGFRLRYFGFRPLGGERSPTANQEAFEERLRALGYID